MKKILIYILLFLIIISPVISYGEEDLKTVIIVLDEISFKDIENLGLEDYGIGLLNLKTRKPDNEISYLTSLNVGRKTNLKDLKEKKLKFNYLGDIFKGRIVYLGDDDSSLNYLTMDKNFKSENLDITNSFENIDRVLKDKDIVAIDYSLKPEEASKNLGEFLNERPYNFYILTKSLSKEDKTIITRWLVPVLTRGERGVLTSESTKRKGLIAVEDISKDLKEKYKLGESPLDIGRGLKIVKDNNNLEFIKDFHGETKSLLIISYGLHGIMYFAQVALILSIYFNKYKKEAIKLFIFAINNILLSLILSMTVYTRNYFIYFALILIMNALMTTSICKNFKSLKILSIMTYGLIVLGMVFKPDIIYKSYIGFNNLMYGVRFYGFNNGMAGVFLASSILVIGIIDKSKLDINISKLLILGVCILNTIVLSTRYAANTGGFITSILLLFVASYIYILPKDLSHRAILGLLILGILIFGLNLHLDSLLRDQSHALSFILRIKENGLGEFFYMAGFKLKELIKFTIMPPFSIVILSQAIIIKKFFRNLKTLKLLLITSILGFLINDTGNVLLIYMLAYGILILIYNMIEIKEINYEEK